VRAHRRVCDVLEVSTNPVDPNEFVKRYIRELELSNEVEEISQVILIKIDRSKYSGVPSNILAAGVIKVACDQADIDLPIWNNMSAKVWVSPDSIYYIYKKIKKNM
jgi:transcription initiation factor TFIIIB Brf1 subunit/transcription initiation factor TFIIB